MKALDDKNGLTIQLIVDEVDNYLPGKKSVAIHLAYQLLSKFFNSDEDKLLFNLSIENAFQITDFGMDLEFILISLLSYAYILGRIPDDDLKVFGDIVLYYLESLKLLGETFESYLPWARSTIIFDEKSSLNEEQKKRFWAERALENRPMAFIGLLPTPSISLIKLVERLTLLKNLSAFSFDAPLNNRIAQDSIDLYAVVAEYLGVWNLKWQIEDQAFKILDPNTYWEIVNDLEERRQERQARIDRASRIISEKLDAEGIKAKVTGRVKHIYGLYKKMMKTGKNVREINDSLGIRIIVNETPEDKPGDSNIDAQETTICYKVKDILFQTFPAAEGVYEEGVLIRDWISNPKPNGYQSIHTTVLFEGKLLEVQIRSKTMHDVAEYGLAAHSIYRKTGKSTMVKKKYQNILENLKKIRLSLESERK